MGEEKHDGLAIPSQIVLAHEPPFTIGDLRIDPSTRQIESRDRRETLEPRVMQVLVALARANGRIVTRDELIDWCWGGRIVGEDAINRAIFRAQCRERYRRRQLRHRNDHEGRLPPHRPGKPR